MIFLHIYYKLLWCRIRDTKHNGNHSGYSLVRRKIFCHFCIYYLFSRSGSSQQRYKNHEQKMLKQGWNHS